MVQEAAGRGREKREKVAYFVVDALRFEMAAGLKEFFDAMPGTSTILKPRLTDLLSVTPVGMNALARVDQAA